MKLIAAIIFVTVTVAVGQDQDWLNECLTAHNDARASHGKPPLTLSDEITQVAQAYADKLSAACAWKHSDTNYGENLSAGHKSCQESVDGWMKEEANYDPSNPVFAMNTGHYTQVVWKSTSQLGCGLASHCKYGWVTVCNYQTPGNYEGEFTENV